MKFVSALRASRRGDFMPCRLSKSSLLVFYFAKNRDDDFYLHLLLSGNKIIAMKRVDRNLKERDLSRSAILWETGNPNDVGA